MALLTVWSNLSYVFLIKKKQARKGFRPLSAMFVIIFFEIFWEFFGRIFREKFWKDFFGEDFFGRNSLFILLKSAILFESERD